MKTLVLFILCFIGFSASAQTANELMGKWQLVKWTHNGKEKDIKGYFKSDQVFQIFNPDGKFESSVGGESHKGKWKLSKNNDELTIISALLPVTFKIDYFDAKKRVVTYPQLGTFEYKKAD